MNKIGNKVYQIKKMTYRNSLGNDIQGVDLTILSFEIIKETPKYYFLQCNKISTYLFGVNKVTNADYGVKRYLKENVEIEGIETKENLIDKLHKAIAIIDKSDDITNNHKKEYRLSYDLLINYFLGLNTK